MRYLSKQIQYIKQVFHYKILHPRTYALLILQFFINYMNVRPIIEFSNEVNYKVSPWVFPFMITDYHYAFLFIIGIIYYFSDVPFMQYQNMYQVIRTGRTKWAMGQICTIILQSLFLMGVNILITILLMFKNLEFTFEWGKLLHTAALTNAGTHYEFLFSISYDTIQQFDPLILMLLTFLLGSLVISFLGILMFMISLFLNRMAAVAVGTAMTVMIFFVENIHPLNALKLSHFVPVDWIRAANLGIKSHGNYMLPSLSYIIVVLLIGILVFSTAIMIRMKHVEFDWTKED